HRIQPIQCLNGTFLVDAEHRCIDRRLEIQTDDIGGFFLELRIVTGNIAAHSMRLEARFCQNARYPDVVGAHFGGNLASRPMRRAINRFALGQSQHSGLELNAFFAATPSTVPAVEATETFPNKALFPQSNRIDTAAHRPTGLGLTVAGRQTQYDLRAHGLSHASAPSSSSTLQHFSLRRRNHDTFRHPFFLPQPHINNQCNSALVQAVAILWHEDNLKGLDEGLKSHLRTRRNAITEIVAKWKSSFFCWLDKTPLKLRLNGI